MVALNAETEKDDGSERQNWEEMVTLNAELEGMGSDDGSKHRNWEAMMALNTETEDDDGSECRN